MALNAPSGGGVAPTAQLPDRASARRLLSPGQARVAVAVPAVVAASALLDAVTGAGVSLLQWGQAAVALATVCYIVVITFRLVLVGGAGNAPILQFSADEVRSVPERLLPSYTVLAPLHREGAVLPHLVGRLSALDYPPAKLQILLLVEEDDGETRTVLDQLAGSPRSLGPPFTVVLVPAAEPRTKPKACNVGLAHATGELCVIYDAEDRPDPDQLRKAAVALATQPDRVVCVQAELAYRNPWTNWLTRCFAAEYAANFSLYLRGLDRHRLAIPLGGTSNHFRTDALRALGGWDPYNVAEDADLGIRIARRGWDVRMMLSVTEEEANSRLGNWIRQRSRWIKGYMQTWLVHSRDPGRLWRELGARRWAAFHLAVGFPALTTLLNPVFWTMTLVYVATGPERIAPFFPGWVFYLGLTAMVLGNATMVYTLMMGCMERGLYQAVRTTLSVPVYWMLMSVAAYKALGQLLRPSRRHHWELTEHGLVPHTDPHPTSGPAAPRA